MRSKLIVILFSCILLSGCFSIHGLQESQLTLSKESRLPVWFTIPENKNREEFTIEINLYTSLFSQPAELVMLADSPQRKIIKKVVGSFSWHPITIENDKNNNSTYPEYFIISVGSEKEIFESLDEGNIVFVTDDPIVRSAIKNEH